MTFKKILVDSCQEKILIEKRKYLKEKEMIKMPLAKCSPNQRKIMLNFMRKHKDLAAGKEKHGSNYKKKMVYFYSK